MRDVVGQLILITRPAGKVFGEQFASLAHAVADSFGELGFSEMCGHGAGDLLPETVAAPRVNSGVADNRKIPT